MPDHADILARVRAALDAWDAYQDRPDSAMVAPPADDTWAGLVRELIGPADKSPATSNDSEHLTQSEELPDLVQRARQALDGGLIGCMECDGTADCDDVKHLVRDLIAEVEKLSAMLDTDNLVDVVERAQGEADVALARAAEAEKAEQRNADSAVKYYREKLAAEAERDELRAEVARLTDDLRVEQSVTHQCEAVDAAIERVRKANGLIHAHRFDFDQFSDTDRAERDAWLANLGETRAGGPDIFYNGIEFAHRRINRALDGEA